MADDTVDFFCPLYGAPADGGDGDFFTEPLETAQLHRRGGGTQGRPRAPPESGTVGCWLVSTDSVEVSSSSSSACPLAARREIRHLEGLALLTWTYEASAVDVAPAGAGGPGAGVHVDSAHWGGVEWSLEEYERLVAPQVVDDEVDVTAAGTAMLFEETFGHVALRDSPLTVSTFLDSSDVFFEKTLVLQKDIVNFCFVHALPVMLRYLKLGPRIDRSLFYLDLPPKSSVDRWRKVAGAQKQRTPTAVDAAVGPSPGERVMLELPTKRPRHDRLEGDAPVQPSVEGTKKDPLRIINAVAFARHLRQQEAFSDAMLDAKRYEENDFTGEVTRDASNDPHKTVLLKASKRLDLVGMAIERRLWHKEVGDDEVEAVVCYSDSSPVTGEEIQGMLVDVCKRDRTVRRVCLPGGSIYYGMQDSIMKTMVFVWATWLCFGPDEFHMKYFIDHCVCWTTDFGVEVHSIEVPNCLAAFMAWVAGKALSDCAVLVKFSQRLFFRSLRIQGWSHCYGNIMKRVAKSYLWWPEVLEHCRHLCRFFRNASWREWLVRAFAGELPNLVYDLASFTATYAKWRFETIINSFEQLLPLRSLCETRLREELFANAQEKKFIADFLTACRDKRTWVFIALATPWIFRPLEHCRRWGLVCSCVRCKELRAGGMKHVECVFNGRRVDVAWAWVKDRCAEFTLWSRNVTVADCEGSEAWRDTISKMCARACSEMKRDCKYLGTVPWLLTTADSVAGALACMTQIRKYPLENHDPVTRYFVQTVGNDLELRSQGGDLTTPLAAEVRALKWASLNESCGEGFHRSTNHEHVRAPAAKTVHLKSKVRAKGVIKTCRSFARKHGEVGKAILRFEWNHVGRILQASRKHRWRSRRLKFPALLKRVYREDQKACENWSSILRRVPLERPAEVAEPTNNREVLEKEYLASVLVPARNFAVDHGVTNRREDGTQVQEVQRDFFTVVNVAHSKAKRSTMHTVEKASEQESTQPFAMEVQLMDRWQDPDGAVGDGVTRVYAESDPEWLVPARIATFSDFAHRLWLYDTVTQDVDHPACLIWSGERRALPLMPLTDQKCPTLWLVLALQKAGWVSVDHVVTHTALKPPAIKADYDGRESMRQKFYYMTLLQLARTLPLSGGSVPSQEPQAFYKLLLRGERTQAGLGNKHYVIQWNKGKDVTDKDALPIEDVGPPAPLQDAGEDFFVPLHGGADPKRKARIHPPGRGGGSRGSGHGRGRGASAGPPPPICAPDLGPDVGGDGAPGGGGGPDGGDGGADGGGGGGDDGGGADFCYALGSSRD